MYTYKNPVIPGYHPDPSVCRDGDDFYLVTSTFEFFPGVPIYHSKNLVNWECIGHCLTRKEQVPLEGCPPSAGIFAPTLRYYNNIWYMTTTNVSGGGNFIVYTADIRGQWSDPVWIAQGGIDPSLLFFDNKVYFCSTGGENESKNGHWEHGIYLCEINPHTGTMVTRSALISKGTGGRNPEAPHIYHKDGWFYLMLAEGGTEYGHMVTIQRSRDIYGPYEPCPYNPILSHRDRGGHSIQATGHADIFQDHNGYWWMVFLGIRPISHSMLHNLGRETFLAPVQWIDGWLVVGNNGMCELIMEGPLPAKPENPDFNFTADFSEPFDLRWNYIRNPDTGRYILKDNLLTLVGDKQTLSTSRGSPVFIGIRQQAFNMNAETGLCPPDTGRAGISVFYNENYHYEIYAKRCQNGRLLIVVNRCIGDLEVQTYKAEINTCEAIGLRINSDREKYRFAYNVNGAWVEAGNGFVAGLCTEITHTMTFTGVYVGLFASGGKADFTRMEITYNLEDM
ncbi:MAG: glycoside hydrolase family 43 protein [Treponema sp.]|jgi:alpha-N-arabinofuranosidase|nr:glycoside hydrolase family 43 protein [Treponema sp.]